MAAYSIKYVQASDAIEYVARVHKRYVERVKPENRTLTLNTLINTFGWDTARNIVAKELNHEN